MHKKIVMALVLIAFLGCTEKKSPPLEIQKKHIDLAKKEPKVQPKVVEEFVPEHIRKSNIEVVQRH